MLIEEDLILLNNDEPTHYHIQSEATQPTTSKLYPQTAISTSIVKFCPVSMEAGKQSYRFKTEEADRAKFNRVTTSSKKITITLMKKRIR